MLEKKKEKKYLQILLDTFEIYQGKSSSIFQ